MSSPEDMPEGFDEEELTPEVAEQVDRLAREYRRHESKQFGYTLRPNPLEEVTEEFREVLIWLRVEDVESANHKNVKGSGEISLDYSAYDVEDTFFIVYGHLKGRRNVRVEDIISEHKETNLRYWRERQTKEAADFLVVHGADENEVNQWKSVEGTARQQRSLRRMYWILSEPYMQNFKDFLMKAATAEKPYNFASLALVVKEIVAEGQDNNSRELANCASLIPRRQEELKTEREWLNLARNICEHVFDRDIEDGVYKPKN